MKLQSISVLGAGRMGEALIAALIEQGASSITACDLLPSRLKRIKAGVKPF